MMEQSQASVYQSDFVLIAGSDHIIIISRSARTRNKPDSRHASSIDIVPERKERIRTEGDLVHLSDPLFSISLNE